MLEILTGCISGIISGGGMGGGTILILILSLFLNMNQKIAQATNLVFFIPTSLAAIFINLKYKKINFKIAKIIIFWGIIGTIIGAIIAKNIEIKILKKLFGFFLLIITIHEIFVIFRQYKNKKKTDNIIE